MSEHPVASNPNHPQQPSNPGRLGRCIGLGIAAIFLMVILSVLGVFLKATRSREQAERLNRLGTSASETQPSAAEERQPPTSPKR